MTHETFCELLPLYVVGALDGAELRKFEQYVASNRARCDSEIAEFQTVADQLAFAAPPAKPSPAVYHRVMAEIEEPQRARSVVVRAPKREKLDLGELIFRWLPWAAAAVLVVMLFNSSARLRDMRGTYAELQSHTAEQQATIALLTLQVGDLNARLDTQSNQSLAQAEQWRSTEVELRASAEQLRMKNEEQTRSLAIMQAGNAKQAAENADLMKVADKLRQDAEAMRKQMDAQKLQVASLEKNIADQTTQLAQQTAQVAQQAAQLDLVLDPAIRVAQLTDPKGKTKAVAKAYWHSIKQTGIVVASNLPPVLKGQGKALELWAICGKEAPVPVGLFWTDADGHGVLEIKLAKGIACVDKFAVTIEPAEGVLAPSGTMVLLGQ